MEAAFFSYVWLHFLSSLAEERMDTLNFSSWGSDKRFRWALYIVS